MHPQTHCQHDNQHLIHAVCSTGHQCIYKTAQGLQSHPAFHHSWHRIFCYGCHYTRHEQHCLYTYGCRRRGESSSSLPSLFTSVGSGQRHRASSKNYASRQTLRLDIVCGQPHHHHWLSAVRGCLPSAIVLFRSLPRVFGTVCRCTSRLHPRCLFSQSSEDAPLQTLLSMTPSSFFLSCLWSDLS